MTGQQVSDWTVTIFMVLGSLWIISVSTDLIKIKSRLKAVEARRPTVLSEEELERVLVKWREGRRGSS